VKTNPFLPGAEGGASGLDQNPPLKGSSVMRAATTATTKAKTAKKPPLKGSSVMRVATTATTKAKTAKHTGSSFGLPNHEIPKIDLPKMEVPAALRELADKGVAQARNTYESARTATEEATDLLENTYKTAVKGATDYNLKVIEIARTNTNTAFVYAYELMGVKSPSEFVELSTAHARKQFEAMTVQTKELTELAQKVTTEIAEPLQAGLTKAFNNKFV
jgi:phasin